MTIDQIIDKLPLQHRNLIFHSKMLTCFRYMGQKKILISHRVRISMSTSSLRIPLWRSFDFFCIFFSSNISSYLWWVRMYLWLTCEHLLSSFLILSIVNKCMYSVCACIVFERDTIQLPNFALVTQFDFLSHEFHFPLVFIFFFFSNGLVYAMRLLYFEHFFFWRTHFVDDNKIRQFLLRYTGAQYFTWRHFSPKLERTYFFSF